MLNIFNGSSTAGSYRRGGGEGEVLVWREALTHGPARAESRSAWNAARAAHLAAAYGEDEATCRRNLDARERDLDRAAEHDEVVLWMGRDLFCLVPLLYLCDRLSKLNLGDTRLTLVCPDGAEAEPSFRCLGEVASDRLVGFAAEREPITGNDLAAANRAWRAYSNPDPTAINAELDGESLWAQALQLHAARFPWAADGLGIVERTLLSLVDFGTTAFPELFVAFGDTLPRYGWGDLQVRNELWRLVDAEPALLTTTDHDDVASASFALTDAGRIILGGGADASPAERWLGGAQLTAESTWRWDSTQRRLVD